MGRGGHSNVSVHAGRGVRGRGKGCVGGWGAGGCAIGGVNARGARGSANAGGGPGGGPDTGGGPGKAPGTPGMPLPTREGGPGGNSATDAQRERRCQRARGRRARPKGAQEHPSAASACPQKGKSTWSPTTVLTGCHSG
jgi:hypothetical protein